MKPTTTKTHHHKKWQYFFVALLAVSFSSNILANTSKSDTKEKCAEETAFFNTFNCNTVDCIKNAMANAEPGDEIIIAPGTYNTTKKVQDPDSEKFVFFSAAANGTAARPITMRGSNSSNKPVLTTSGGGDIMMISGNYWIIRDLEVSGGDRGILTHTANNLQLINLTVGNCGKEAIHFRANSSNNLVKNCTIRNTGLDQANRGEGVYVGSDRSSHGTYDPFCNDNIIEGCTFGPNITAEAIDVKEQTNGTIIRNNTFDARGMAGAVNDAFIDLKGSRSFVYNNTFNQNNENKLNSIVDLQERTSGDGFRNAIFDNTINLTDTNVATARKKQADANLVELHIWDNKRNPASPDYPDVVSDSDDLTNIAINSCPSWNIISCGSTGGGGPTPPANQAPSVSITSPANGASFTTGANITIQANASDSDGNVTQVAFYNNGNLLGTDTTGSSYNFTINNASAGSYSLTAIARDNDGATTTSAARNITVANATPPAPTCSGGGVSITNRIQAEDFCAMNGIQTENTADTGGGTNVGYIDTGDYIEYRVNIPSNGQYTIDYRVASRFSSGEVDFVVNGSSKGRIAIPNTGNWQSWTTITRDVSLSSGSQTIRLLATGPRWNINWFKLTEKNTDPDPDPDPDPNPNPTTCAFGTPTSGTLPSFARVKFNNIYVLGNGGPDASNLKRFSINWNQGNSKLVQFAINTRNGQPDYYVDLRGNIDQSFGSSNPSVAISNSGIAGLDGDYYVTKDGTNFVMVSKNQGFTIYCSNSSSAPSCTGAKASSQNDSLATFTVTPNPSNGLITINGLPEAQTSVMIYDIQGKVLLQESLSSTNNTLDIRFLNAGMYLVRTNSIEASSVFKIYLQ